MTKQAIWLHCSVRPCAKKEVTTDFVSHLMPFHAHVVVWCYYSRLNSVVLVQKRQRTEPCTICFAIDIYDIIVRAKILVHVLSKTNSQQRGESLLKKILAEQRGKRKELTMTWYCKEIINQAMLLVLRL